MKKAPKLTSILLAVATTLGVAVFTAGAHSAFLDQATSSVGKSQPEPDSPTGGNGEVEPNNAEPSHIGAAELLRNARQNLHGYRSIKASLIETVVIRDRKFRASGTYLQGRELKMKMSLSLRLGPQGRFQSTMLQVCDGQVLWTSYQSGRRSGRSKPTDGSQAAASGIEHRITRRDVRQILREAARFDQTPQALLFAELGLGGLSELLGSLQKTMVFGKVRSQKIDGKPFLVVQGRWDLKVLGKFLSREELDELRSSGDGRTLPRLPEHVPDMVRLYFDSDSLFPRRILYLKRPDLSQSLRPMLALNFVDVVLNAPIDDREFQYVPPAEVYPQDITPKYVKQIRRAAKLTAKEDRERKN